MDGQAKLTVKEYASFFRILFNSSYLSADNSERALNLLAHTEYHDALPSPQGVVVAHKFGEAGTENIERQLHDCGIVYLPDHPYLACIMTRGRDAEKLKLGSRTSRASSMIASTSSTKHFPLSLCKQRKFQRKLPPSFPARKVSQFTPAIVSQRLIRLQSSMNWKL